MHLNMEHLHMVELHSDLTELLCYLSGATNLRDTIAFPKTASASDLLTAAPDSVDDSQLAELGINIVMTKSK